MRLGDHEPEILNVGMRGILMVNTEHRAIKDHRLGSKTKLVEEPWLIRYCLTNNSNSKCN